MLYSKLLEADVSMLLFHKAKYGSTLQQAHDHLDDNEPYHDPL